MASAPLPAPDLDTPEGKLAYRAELSRVSRWPRMIGLAFILSGAAVMILAGQGLFGLRPGGSNVAAFACLAVGWLLLVVSLLQRNRYHRRRMAGE